MMTATPTIAITTNSDNTTNNIQQKPTTAIPSTNCKRLQLQPTTNSLIKSSDDDGYKSKNSQQPNSTNEVATTTTTTRTKSNNQQEEQRATTTRPKNDTRYTLNKNMNN